MAQKIWRSIKLIPIIIKNLFLIGGEELVKLIKRKGLKKTFLFLLVIGVIFSGAFWVYLHYFSSYFSQENSLAQAGKIGKVSPYKLMIKINGKKQSSSDNYQRGDIILIQSADHQFSTAEKNGFLIIKVELTSKQAELLTQALVEKAKEEKTKNKENKENKDEKDQEKEFQKHQEKIIQLRKYYVDLKKIGIGSNVQRGREIDDKTFRWEDIIKVKKD